MVPSDTSDTKSDISNTKSNTSNTKSDISDTKSETTNTKSNTWDKATWCTHGGDLHDAVCRGGRHVCLRGPPTHPASVPQPSHPPARRWDDLHGLAESASAHEVCVRLLSLCVLALSASRGDHKILFTPLFAWLCARAPLLHRQDGTLPCDATTVRALRTTSFSQGLAHAPPRSQWLAGSP